MDGINYTFETSKIDSISSKTRKKKNKEKYCGYKIGVSTECDSDFLKSLAIGKAPNYDDFFFEDDGSLKSSCISDFTVARPISDHKIKLDFDLVSEQNMIFLNTSIEGFKVSPIFGKLYRVKFVVNLEPNDDELLFLNEAVKKDQLIVSILEPPQMAFEI